MVSGYRRGIDACRRTGGSSFTIIFASRYGGVRGHRYPASPLWLLTGLLAAGRSLEAAMKFWHAFTVPAPASIVAAFHRNPVNLIAITPPFVRMKLLAAPNPLRSGDEISFLFWLGFIPVRWVARIVQMDESGFTDVQISGPFRLWVHRHQFISKGDGSTLVLDRIEASLSWHPLFFFIGLLMWLGLPFLFAYRRKATTLQIARLLEVRRTCEPS